MNEPTTIPSPSFTRRRVLGGAAVIGAGLVAAACASDDNSATSPTNSTSSSAGSQAPDPTPAATTATTDSTATETTAAGEENIDLQVAGLAASLEVLAVQTYQAALDAAGAGSLGEVPPAVGEFVTTAMAQHQEHLDAWNTVLSGAGAAEVTEPNTELKPTVDAAFAEVTDVAGAAELALMLEEIAAATYLSAQNVLTDKDAIMLAGSIQIIDAQHAAILYYVLGEYPVPDVFAKTDLAAASAGTPSAGSATPSTGSTSAASNPPAATGTPVSIDDFAFSPDTVTVAVGTTITWTNDQDVAHTVTADDGSFDSGNLAPGDTFEHTFDAAGTFTYLCSIHPNMTGTIIVQ